MSVTSDLKGAGVLRNFVLPYLGEDDSRLKFRPADLVTREEAFAYPTDFFPMKEESIDRLSRHVPIFSGQSSPVFPRSSFGFQIFPRRVTGCAPTAEVANVQRQHS